MGPKILEFSEQKFLPKKSWLRMSISNNDFPIFVRGFLPRKIFPGKRNRFRVLPRFWGSGEPSVALLATADAGKVTKDSILPTYPVRVYEHSILYRTGGARSRSISTLPPRILQCVYRGRNARFRLFLACYSGKRRRIMGMSPCVVISDVPI